MIVVGIIAVMLAGAVMSIASGRSGVKVKEATRGVVQLSRYASALALLRQRPVVVTFHRKGKVEVRISGESTGAGAKSALADPIYLTVNGEMTQTAEELAAEAAYDSGSESQAPSVDVEKEKKSLFFTRQPLDPDALAKEDAEGVYEGVTFTVEVLGEDGEPLPAELAAARSLKQPEREKAGVDVFNSLDVKGEEETETEDDDVPPVSVTYETNGNVNPHRIIIRQTDASESDEGFAVSISRSGKATVGDDEEDGRESRNVRRRRR